jgi:thioredoxin reductase
MSCALWLHNYGLQPIIVEQRPALGGMARASPYANEWLLGRPHESGRQNAEEFAHHIRLAAVETWLDARPRWLHRAADGGFRIEVVLAAQRVERSLSCSAVVMATGTDFRGDEWLDRVANARPLAQAGRVHLGPSDVGELGADLGAHVAVIGGGDNAFDLARMLAERGVQVTLIMRARSPRARPQLVGRLRQYEASGLARVMAERTVEALDDLGSGLGIRLRGGERVVADQIVLLLGYRPSSRGSWLAELAPTLDANGYVVVDGNMETSCHGLFAVGDVANPAHPCIATAIASGTMAAREIQRRLATR